jgi:hypothetical protein
MRFAAASFTLLALGIGHAVAATPVEITAEYQLSHRAFGVVARMTETFTRTGDSYAIRSTLRPEGALKMFFSDQVELQSAGKVVSGGLQPMSFSNRRLGSTKGDTRATFDWDKGIMHSTHEGVEKDVPLPPGTQDRVSIMYQFMNLPMGATVTMQMTSGRKVEQYTYRLVGEERVTTPAGEFPALHYERVAAPGESKAEVWLAKERFNLPVRVLFDDPKGLRLEQLLVALNTR